MKSKYVDKKRYPVLVRWESTKLDGSVEISFSAPDKNPQGWSMMVYRREDGTEFVNQKYPEEVKKMENGVRYVTRKSKEVKAFTGAQFIQRLQELSAGKPIEVVNYGQGLVGLKVKDE